MYFRESAQVIIWQGTETAPFGCQEVKLWRVKKPEFFVAPGDLGKAGLWSSAFWRWIPSPGRKLQAAEPSAPRVQNKTVRRLSLSS
ncbi:MAG: hypothetical protein DMG38_22315 [Acidobacteria bacterium]|nr:MAG: hypothetical protein DMG38_22315 [Acidobacteriota bacterium]